MWYSAQRYIHYPCLRHHTFVRALFVFTAVARRSGSSLLTILHLPPLTVFVRMWRNFHVFTTALRACSCCSLLSMGCCVTDVGSLLRVCACFCALVARWCVADFCPAHGHWRLECHYDLLRRLHLPANQPRTRTDCVRHHSVCRRMPLLLLITLGCPLYFNPVMG